MKTSFNIATYPARAKTLRPAIESVINQVDLVRLFVNEVDRFDFAPLGQKLLERIEVLTYPKNMYDNGKFYGLDYLNEPEYYFTGDDDLIYPEGYVAKGIKDIQTFGCIITYHGRIIETAGVNYYYGHKTFRCLEAQSDNIIVDVAGSGVT